MKVLFILTMLVLVWISIGGLATAGSRPETFEDNEHGVVCYKVVHSQFTRSDSVALSCVKVK